MNKISVKHIGNNHSDWLRALDFYKQEIGILKGRLTEVASKNTDKDIAANIEHFENQFIVQRDNIDKLKHDISLNVSEAAKQAETSGAGYVDGMLLAQHETLEQEFKAEEKMIADLRHDFNRFAATWL